MLKTAPSFFRYLTAFLPAVLWAIVIFFLSSQQVLPSLSLSTWDFVFKKTAHIFSYGLLYWLLFRAFRQTTNFTDLKLWTVPLLITLLYACFDEIHQTYTPGRHGTTRDIGFDALGCGLVIMRKLGYI